MIFEDLDTKNTVEIEKNKAKVFCVPAGDHVDGFVKDPQDQIIQKMPIQHLMWYTKTLDININPEGKIIFNLTTEKR
jgi:hypothetical protein